MRLARGSPLTPARLERRAFYFIVSQCWCNVSMPYRPSSASTWLIVGRWLHGLSIVPTLLLLVRPPDVVVSGLRFYHGFFFFFLSFFSSATHRARWTELNQNGHILGSECDLKMHAQNLGYPIHLQVAAPEPPFSTTSRLNGNFNWPMSSTSMLKLHVTTWLINEDMMVMMMIGQVRWQLKGVSYTISKCHELWSVHKRFSGSRS